MVELLNAGVDLLLVAFDGARIYRIFTCAAEGLAQGKLDTPTLSESEARLMGAVPADERGYQYRPGYR